MVTRIKFRKVVLTLCLGLACALVFSCVVHVSINNDLCALSSFPQHFRHYGQQFVPLSQEISELLYKIESFQLDAKRFLGQLSDAENDSGPCRQDILFRQKLSTFVKEVETFIAQQDLKTSDLLPLKGQTGYNFSCPEIYKGSTYGYPFYRTGFETVNCSKIPISKSVSIIIYLPSTSLEVLQKTTDSLYKEINIFYPGIQVYELSIQHNHKAQTRQNFTKTISFKDIGRIVDTEFTFFLTNPVLFDKNSDLERLIRVLTDRRLSAVAVGGAIKNLKTGKWNNACIQTSLSNYVFRKTSGYRRSAQECLVCDSLMGPFLVRTESIRRLPLEDLGDGTFENWFWNVKLQNRGNHRTFQVLSCPDVMFASDETIADQRLSKFADKWNIQRIVEPTGNVRWYGCSKDRLSMGSDCTWTKGMANSPCCLKALADAITFFMNACERFNITCELQEGTHLGALKFEYVLPWERDADLTFLSADFDRLHALEGEFRDAGYTFGVVSKPWCCVSGISAGGVFSMRAGPWHLEIYGQHLMDSSNLKKKGMKPTLLRFGDGWVQVPENPGLFARNRYGKEIYKHAEHWFTSSQTTGWAPYKAGRFNPCPEPGHHGCLDHFEADGNLQLKYQQ